MQDDEAVFTMGRIVAAVTIENLFDAEKNIRCDALVDTGASHMLLPSAWKDRLGDLRELGMIDLETATQRSVQAAVCGPVQIQIEGFRPIFSEVLFVDMEPEEGKYEPLIGYIVLEQSQAAVDTFGQRLIHVKRLGLKSGASKTPKRVFSSPLKKRSNDNGK
jgi:predicted aspartyl protease